MQFHSIGSRHAVVGMGGVVFRDAVTFRLWSEVLYQENHTEGPDDGTRIGGATGAALAAIVMIFEMTLDYTVIIPVTLTVAISYAVRKSMIRDSIYTRKLTLRGSWCPSPCEPIFNSPVAPQAL